MIKTRITELFSIKHPIIQSGMQNVSKAELVSSVANAGALGFLSALTFRTPEELYKEINKTKNMTDNIFGVNLTILPSVRPIPYLEYADVIANSGITVVETAGRSPEFLMDTFNRNKVKVIHKCTSIKHAKKAELLGCSAITIDGFEAAGHPGEDDIPSLILLPRAVEEVNVPIIACGGFSDARGVVAALALGAEGVAMGTRFLVTKEAPVHQNIKEKIMKCNELDTRLILRAFHNTARVFKNETSDAVYEIEKNAAVTFTDVADLVSGERGKVALDKGLTEEGILWAGLSSGLISDLPNVEYLISKLIIDAKSILQRNLEKFYE